MLPFQLRYPVAARDELDKAEAWLAAKISGRWNMRFGGFMAARDRATHRRIQAISLIASFESDADRRVFARDFLYTELPVDAAPTTTLDPAVEQPAAAVAPPPSEPPTIDAPVIEATRPARPDDKPPTVPAGGKLFDFKA
ncbi:hypothetical protein [Oceanibaculum pacificum]|uniref:Uncharacterized protein n=1 Tax=Oceanibaculum pacificum TaxID=580166 RepID=A0A154W8G0_9PROT|nr:hypothetical protein [Oceanibaculum pacificum]KZD09776.1 hypothetical protein AUP43_00920 [Oceanibaculum pacificum]